MSSCDYRPRTILRASGHAPDCGRNFGASPAVVVLLVVLWTLVAGSPPRACAQVNDIYRISNGAFATHVEYHGIDLPPGKEFVLADLAGPGKIVYFYYTDDSFHHATDSSGSFYEGLVLKVYWDNAAEPSIRVPLWAFFGVFHRQAVDYQSLPMQINHYNFMCYLPMPFSQHARLVLSNDGDAEYKRSVAYGVDYESDPAFASEKSRLHAAWNRTNPTDGMHRLLEVAGRGQYIGNFLQVATQYPGWWGEGDTIFHVDGQAMTHTPGTEDEYGACWGFGHTYSYIYSGYIQMDEGQNRMYRWYLANPVRFQKSLVVDIQNQRATDNAQVPSHDDYTSVAFWYQEGAHAAPALKPYAERIAPNRSGEYPMAPLK
jgi:hypothetical protein